MDKIKTTNVIFVHSSTKAGNEAKINFIGDAVAEKLANFIELVNNWFDIMNSYTPNGIAYKAPYGLNIEEQDRVLDKIYSTVKSMKYYNSKGKLQQSLQIFQKGILMFINSLKSLREEMNKKYKFNFVLTHRLNQDCLENFFCQMRGRNGPNDHPSPVECLYTIKGIILGKNPGLPQHLHSNTVERDPEEYVSATFMEHLHNNEDACVHKDYQCEEYANIEFLENFDATDDVESSLENVANEMTEEFLEDYSSDIGVSLTDSNITNTCIDLEVELLDEAEFLNDEMAIDDKSLRRNTLTEDGLEHLAGWISWKFKKSNPGLSSTRRETLPSYVTDHTYMPSELERSQTPGSIVSPMVV